MTVHHGSVDQLSVTLKLTFALHSKSIHILQGLHQPQSGGAHWSLLGRAEPTAHRWQLELTFGFGKVTHPSSNVLDVSVPSNNSSIRLLINPIMMITQYIHHLKLAASKGSNKAHSYLLAGISFHRGLVSGWCLFRDAITSKWALGYMPAQQHSVFIHCFSGY